MPQPTIGDVHVNRPLTNLSTAFIQDSADFIADKVFPMVPVSKRSDQYFQYDKGAWFRSDVQERAPGTESAGSGFKLSTAAYLCKVLSLHKMVDDQTRANSDDPIRPDSDATRYISQQHLLKKDLDWQDKYFKTSVWDTDFTPGTLWSAAAGDPIKDIRAQKRVIKSNTGMTGNVLVVSADVDDIIKDNASVLDRIKYTQTGIVSNDLIAKALELDMYLVANAVRNTATEGAADALSHLFTKDALLVHAPRSPGLMTPSAGYTFTWTGLLGVGAAGMQMKKMREELKDADRIQGTMSYDQKVVSTELGVFFSGAIA